MHELSIMISVVDICLEQAKQENATKITSIQLEVGDKAGVVIDSLEFACDAVTRGTIAEGAALDIVRVPLIGKCLDCGFEFEAVDGKLVCPKCEGWAGMVKGKELNILSIEID